MLREIYTAAQSRYARKSPTSIPAEIVDSIEYLRAEDKPNGGIIRSIPDRIELDGGLRGKELKAAKAKARREHKEALRNLAKRELESSKLVAMQIKQYKREQAEQARKSEKAEQERKASKERANGKKRADLKIKTAEKKAKKVEIAKITSTEPSAYSLIEKRRAELASKLLAGEMIPVVESKEPKHWAEYQMQRLDTKVLISEGLDVTRIRNIKTGVSYLTIDNYKRHEMPVVNGTLRDKDSKRLIQAVCSGELVELGNIKQGARTGAASVTQLAVNHGFNIFTIFDGRFIKGWILIEGEL
ncbi:hypothetical protein ACS8E2_12640 [Psychrobacter glaciei]|uniref:hypothetical protein n=1 Tax=Psychrobacter glaciei TaxID=619771 RepID=UPI003F4649C4